MQAAPDKPRVGLVTDMGRIDDGTFNQYAYEGLMRAVEELGLPFEVIETDANTSVEANVREIIERGCTLVVAVGALRAATAVERMSMRHPDVHFVTVD